MSRYLLPCPDAPTCKRLGWAQASTTPLLFETTSSTFFSDIVKCDGSHFRGMAMLYKVIVASVIVPGVSSHIPRAQRTPGYEY